MLAVDSEAEGRGFEPQLIFFQIKDPIKLTLFRIELLAKLNKVFFVSPSTTISSHFKKRGYSLRLPEVLDNSERLLYLTRCHSLLRPWWIDSESHLITQQS